MIRLFSILTLTCTCIVFTLSAQDFQKDTFDLSGKSLVITFIGHGSLMMDYDGDIIHIDPSSREADYEKLPDADLVLISHHHGDHCDSAAYHTVKSESTTTLLTQLAKDKLQAGEVINNGDSAHFNSIKIEAIPAYNLVHKRDNGEFYHPKGCCNSYILNIGDFRIYIGGDTENTPEMKALENIDVAFLPMNLPYTMTPEMVADAAKAFRPTILYPYHYGKTDVSELLKLMNEEEDIEIRVRDME